MIPYEISSKVLTIGPALDGKGGIAILIRSISVMFERFRFIISLQGTTKVRKLLTLMLAETKLISECLFGGIEVVHIHTGSGIDFQRNAIFACTAKLLKKKVILHIHGGAIETYYTQHHALVQRICGSVDMLITVSTHFVDFLFNNHLNNRIRLLHNLTQPPVILPRTEDASLVKFLFLGRVDQTKGIFDVLECIAANKLYFQDKIIFDIAGGGETDHMHKLIRQNGLESFVRFHGWVDAEQKQMRFSQADVFIHPSYIESFGIAILEAMSYGIPVITTSIGGIPDLIDDQQSGIMVEPGNKEQILHAMQRLMEDVALRKQMGAEAKKKAENFYPDKIEQKLQELYVELL